MSLGEFVVFDLEFTSWEGAMGRNWSGPGEHREIVQIGAVRLTADWTEIASFMVYVKPRINPILSNYLTNLTGITQAQVDELGIDVDDALNRLLDFAAPAAPMLSNGTDDVVLAENCRLVGRDDPFVGRTRNVRRQLENASGRTDLVSAHLPEIFGLPQQGRGHDALADSRCVAAALRHLAAG